MSRLRGVVSVVGYMLSRCCCALVGVACIQLCLCEKLLPCGGGGENDYAFVCRVSYPRDVRASRLRGAVRVARYVPSLVVRSCASRAFDCEFCVMDCFVSG